MANGDPNKKVPTPEEVLGKKKAIPSPEDVLKKNDSQSVSQFSTEPSLSPYTPTQPEGEDRDGQLTTPQSAKTAPLDKIKEDLLFYRDFYGDDLARGRRLKEFNEITETYNERLKTEAPPEEKIPFFKQEAFNEYVQTQIDLGNITQDEADAAIADNPSDVFRAVAVNKTGLRQTDKGLEEIQDGSEWGPRFFGTETDLVEENMESAVSDQKQKEVDALAEKLKSKFIESLPEEKRNDKEYLEKIEDDLMLNHDTAIDLTGDNKWGAVKGTKLGDFAQGLGYSLEKFALTAVYYGTNNPALKPVIEARRDMVDRKKLENITQVEGDFLDALKRGDTDGAVRSSLNMIAESAPHMALAGVITSATGNPYLGYASIATSSAGEQYLDVKDEEWFKDLSPTEGLGYVVASGAFEAVGEVAGARIITRSAKELLKASTKDAASQTIRQFLKGAALQMGIGLSEETLAESVTAIGQYTTDAIAKGEDITIDGILDRGLRGAASGLGMAGGMTIGTTTAQTSVFAANKFGRDFSRRRIDRMISGARDELVAAPTKEARLEIAKDIEDLFKRRNEMFARDREFFESMDRKDLDSYIEKANEFDELGRRMQVLDEGSKVRERLETRASEVKKEISQIEEKYEKTKQEQTEEEQQQEQAETQPKEQTEEVLDKGAQERGAFTEPEQEQQVEQDPEVTEEQTDESEPDAAQARREEDVTEPVKLKYEQTETPQTFEEVDGGDRVYREAAQVFNKSLDRRTGEETATNNAVDYIQGTKAYEGANDVQREQMIRDFRSQVGAREKKAPSAKKFTGVKPDKKVTMTDKQLVKQRIQDMVKAANQGYRTGRREIKDLSGKIEEILTDAPKGLLTSNEISTLIKGAARVSTPNQLNKFNKQVSQTFSKAEDRRHGAEIKDLKTRTKPSKYTETRAGGIRKGKISNYERKVITAVNKALVDGDVDAMASRMDDIQGEARSPDANIENLASELEGLTIAIKATRGLDGVRQAREDVKNLAKEGKSKIKEDLAKKHERYKELKDGTMEAVTAGRGVPAGMNRKNKIKENKFFLNNLFRTVDAFLDAQNGFRLILDKIDRGPRDAGDTFSSFLEKNIWNPLSSARRNKTIIIEEATQKMQDKLLEIYGTKKAVRKALHEANKQNNLGSFVDGKGQTVEIELSSGQAYYIYNLSKDPNNTPTFEEMGWTPEMLSAVENSLDSKTKQWADWQVNEFYPEMHKKINGVYKKMNYMDLPKNENYVPIRRESVSAGFEETIDGFRNSVVNLEYGSLKERRGSKAPFDLTTNGDSVLHQYMESMGHYVAFAETVKDLNVVFTDKSIREAIRLENNNYVVNIVEGFIKDIAQEGRKQRDAFQILDKFRGWHTTSSLAVSPLITIKQFTSAPAFVADIGVRGFLNGSRRFFTNPVETSKNIKWIFKNSPVLRDRYRKGWTRDTVQAMRTDYYDSLGGKPTLLGQLMFNVKWGDAGGIALGYSSWYGHYRDAKKNNMSETEAKEYALKKFEEALRISQQSGVTEDLSDLQRKNAFSKLFTMYQSSPIQYFAQERKAVRDMIRGMKDMDSGRVKDGVRRFAVYHFALPVIFQWVSNAMPGVLTDFDDEDESDLIRAISLGSLNGVFILGDFMTYVGEVVSGKPWAQKGGHSITPAFQNIYDFGYSFASLLKKWWDNQGELEADVMKTLLEETIVDFGDAAGMPVSRLTKTLKAFKDEEDKWDDYTEKEKSAIIMGYSPKYIDLKKQKAEGTDNSDSWKFFPDIVKEKTKKSSENLGDKELKFN